MIAKNHGFNAVHTCPIGVVAIPRNRPPPREIRRFWIQVAFATCVDTYLFDQPKLPPPLTWTHSGVLLRELREDHQNVPTDVTRRQSQSRDKSWTHHHPMKLQGGPRFCSRCPFPQEAAELQSRDGGISIRWTIVQIEFARQFHHTGHRRRQIFLR